MPDLRNQPSPTPAKQVVSEKKIVEFFLSFTKTQFDLADFCKPAKKQYRIRPEFFLRYLAFPAISLLDIFSVGGIIGLSQFENYSHIL